MVTHSEKFTEAIASLYYLISSADGKISDFEKRICEHMMETEKISEKDFNMFISSIEHLSQDEVYAKCIKLLNVCPQEEQIRALAWMRNIANSDGFMAKEEWALIFKIYKRELQLNLKDIIDCELPIHVGLA